ncbi:MAG: phycocyanobilin:ferredoxin oxidoreductase, partial [Microcystis panniformis]
MIAVAKTEILQLLHPMIGHLATANLSHCQNYHDMSPLDLPEGLGYVEGRVEGEKLFIENLSY